MRINPYIFREYDIRGIFGQDLTDDVIAALAKAYGTFFRKNDVKHITIGGDVRLSTAHIRHILIEEITACGIDITNIGMVPTPVQYFSMFHLPVQGGIMITGSHNPPEYNGFKITLNKAPVYGKDIIAIKNIIENNQYVNGSGHVYQTDVIDDYIQAVKETVNLRRPVKMILDSGNGAAGPVAGKLFRTLGMDVIDLYPEPDGNFPNHHPDPTVVENIQDLIKSVRRTRSECGIGYDGDGDRIGVVDEKGEIIWGDRLLMIFSREILRDRPGAPIIYEVKCSEALTEMITKYGGKPVMWKTGHSLLKKKMKEMDSPLAGEMSGHLFFADRYFGFDDAIYASVRLAELISHKEEKLSELLKDVPTYYATPEIRAEAASDQIKFDIARQAKTYFSENYDVIDVDGVRIQFNDGWGLVRASNTQPVIVLRFEARTADRLEEIKELVISKLAEFGDLKIND